jgi:hypothetical protein
MEISTSAWTTYQFPANLGYIVRPWAKMFLDPISIKKKLGVVAHTFHLSYAGSIHKKILSRLIQA